jgi:SAM-dependent methyltransferase
MQRHGMLLTPFEKSCPLCAGDQFRLIDSIPVSDLCAEYHRQLHVDVREEFASGTSNLDLNECLRCGLQVFYPLVSGSPNFYSGLSSAQSYYSNSRWEFSRAFKWIGDQTQVIDVGCGDGYFLSLIPHKNKIGLEHNPAAVALARKRGLDVRSAALSDLPDGTADTITFFQVLEHVVNPLDMLREALRVMRPSGFLLIAVPNNDGFMGRAIQQPLNSPPHHPLRWTRCALNYLSRLFPLVLRELVDEPLAQDQLFLYRRTLIIDALARCLGRRLPLMKLNPATIFLRKATNALALLSLKLDRKLPAKSVSGHSTFAVYQKNE